jgi:ATP-dependent DNA ligase
VPSAKVEVALGARLRETEPDILLNEYIGEDGLTVLAHACQLGAEGIVSKKQLVPMRDLVNATRVRRLLRQ